MIKVFIADDHRLFRETLRKALISEKIADVLADVANGQELLNQMDKIKPQVILMDIAMPIMDGIEATKKALEKQPDVKIISLSQFGDENYYYSMVEAGVKGFVLKSSGIDELKNAIIEVANGGNWVSPDLFQKVVIGLKNKEKKSNPVQLTNRELEILKLICKGHNNEQIANTLYLSFDTIRWYRARLLSKTGCPNTAGLVMFAVKNRLIEF